MVFYVYFRTI
jgi:coiled-coil and C2 domain-containing protein 2A